jgi:16S rRNA (cytosine1402-N4)-methyltransferase
MQSRKAIKPSQDELAANPRARSAKLRLGRRTEALALPVDLRSLGVPQLPQRRAS